MKLSKLLIVLIIAISVQAAKSNKERLDDAATVMQEVMATSDRSIPQSLLDKSHCVVIVPGLKKGAFIVGAHYGKGYVSCRNEGGIGWSAPATITVEGGSVGFQIGATETDLIMLVMNSGGANKLMQSQFTLGGTAQVAAGPVGRTAAADTDALMHAEIISYSRARGVFAGVSLQGATLREDMDSNKDMYGQRLKTSEIVHDPKIAPTPAGKKLIDVLAKYSPREVDSARA